MYLTTNTTTNNRIGSNLNLLISDNSWLLIWEWCPTVASSQNWNLLMFETSSICKDFTILHRSSLVERQWFYQYKFATREMCLKFIKMVKILNRN